MKQILGYILLMMTLNSLGQNLYFDNKRIKYPDLDLKYTDSITTACVYKSTHNFTFTPELPISKGYLLYRFTFDNNHKISEIITYNTMIGYRLAKFIFKYSYDSLERVTKLNNLNKTKHYWLLKNGKLLEEGRYNLMQKLTDKWCYSYVNDTLILNVIKYNKHNRKLYELKFKYDSLNRLIEQKEYNNNGLVAVNCRSYNNTSKLQSIKLCTTKFDALSSKEKTYVVNENIVNENIVNENIVNENIVNENIVNENNASCNFTNFDYDNQDRVSKMTIIKEDSTIISYDVYTYGLNGKLRELVTFNKLNKPIRKQVFEFNESGKEIGYTEYTENIGKDIKPIFDKKIIVNQSGNIYRVEIIDRYKKETVLYTYEYK